MNSVSYEIQPGQTIYREMNTMYSFQGWSVDEMATRKGSQGNYFGGNTTVGGKTLAGRYYSYVKPAGSVKNPERENIAVNNIMLSQLDMSERTNQIIKSANQVYPEYENDLKNLIARYTNAYKYSYIAKAADTKLKEYHDDYNKTIGKQQYKEETTGDTVSNNPNSTVLYAMWDRYPVFDPVKPMHTFMSTSYSNITDDWLLSHVRVTDHEDGVLKNGTQVVVENFDLDEIKQLQHTGIVSVGFKATDTAGNVTHYTAQLVVEDRTPYEKITPDDLTGKLYYETGYSRGISRKYFEIGDPESDNYYGQGYDGVTINRYGQKVPRYLYEGGLSPNSRWYTDPEWKAEVYEGFENEENGTPEEVWEFSHQDILDIQQYIQEKGFGNLKSDNALAGFHSEFAPRCRTVYDTSKMQDK